MPQAKTNRIDAVNQILIAAGEAPVSNLSNQAGVHAVAAQKILDNTDREVQTLGWAWNRRSMTFTPANGTIPVAENIIRFEGSTSCHYMVRGGNLFWIEGGTDEFDAAVTLIAVELLAWDDVPEAARQYIVAKAARKFADEVVGDTGLAQALRVDEAEAHQKIRKLETTMGRHTIFAPEDAAFVNRGSPLYYG
jgi:hypothetical protein